LRRAPRQVPPDRRYARRLHRGDRGVPGRRLHARDARVVGREPPRADPAVRREGAAAIPSRVDILLAGARKRIVRYTPEAAAADPDLLIVDIRSVDERERTGVIPGSKHVPRSVLEWRADPTSEWHDPELAGKRLVLLCAHGYSSSLAPPSLVELGVEAGELEGGFEGWVAAGLQVE